MASLRGALSSALWSGDRTWTPTTPHPVPLPLVPRNNLRSNTCHLSRARPTASSPLRTARPSPRWETGIALTRGERDTSPTPATQWSATTRRITNNQSIGAKVLQFVLTHSTPHPCPVLRHLRIWKNPSDGPPTPVFTPSVSFPDGVMSPRYDPRSMVPTGRFVRFFTKGNRLGRRPSRARHCRPTAESRGSACLQVFSAESRCWVNVS